ncbi:polyhydroxyalkanoate synthesis repressor phar [hydrocarbon metagenome]|uniref:Polyhydroxyalkanoate synthesis repressor phar n=1 Tax=hydrocarbon metagenome TaxID=938273 RepID=A0A0W8E8M3_9ZZZZ
MSEDTKSTKRNYEDLTKVPDLLELWKKMYFKTEEACSGISKEFVASKTFVDMLDQARDQYLSHHKLSEQFLDQYYDNNPVPSKKDIARVAELVIALEDKVDNLDIQIMDNINIMAKSMLKLVDSQQASRDEAVKFREEIQNLNEKLDYIEAELKRLVQQLKSDPETISHEETM